MEGIIPIDSQIGIEDGRASYNDGFPPLTMTPVSSGGVPPYGADFNGVLNAITACLRWNNAGMSYIFDSTFATKIQGYPKGAVVANSDNSGFWINTRLLTGSQLIYSMRKIVLNIMLRIELTLSYHSQFLMPLVHLYLMPVAKVLFTQACTNFYLKISTEWLV